MMILSIWLALGTGSAQAEPKVVAEGKFAPGAASFTSFSLSEHQGESELALKGGKGECRFSLESVVEESGSKKLRFQGTKIDCESTGASTVVGYIDLGGKVDKGAIRLLSGARPVLSLTIQSYK